MYLSGSSTTQFGKLKLHDNPHALHSDTDADVDSDQKHTLCNESALDKVTHVSEGRAISIEHRLVLGTAFSLGREAENTCDDYQGDVCTAAATMATSTKGTAWPKNSSSSEKDKHGENGVDQIKVRVES